MTLMVCTLVCAQTNSGTVNGHVADAVSAAVADCIITLLNTKTGVTLTGQSDREGSYVFALVQPGAFRLTVEKAGFQKFVTQFELSVNQIARVDALLAVGQVTDAITVSERSVLIENETSSLGQVISSRQVADLPLNGRNPFALAALTPGVLPLGCPFA